MNAIYVTAERAAIKGTKLLSGSPCAKLASDNKGNWKWHTLIFGIIKAVLYLLTRARAREREAVKIEIRKKETK